MATRPKSNREIIAALFKTLDMAATFIGPRGDDMRRHAAEMLVSDWRKIFRRIHGDEARQLVLSLRGGKWKPIGVYFPMYFKIWHNIPPTEQQLAAGPDSGWWFIKSTIAPFSSLPGVPYIHIPGMAWLVTGTSGLAPICRISTSP